MARIGGLNGRPADEFTFIPQDALVAEGQQEALNPNIITNRICDQLTNVCDANDAAKAACEDAKAEIEALGTRDQSTADTWNALLGFAGVDSTGLNKISPPRIEKKQSPEWTALRSRTLFLFLHCPVDNEGNSSNSSVVAVKQRARCQYTRQSLT
ncbi:hypothetical protein NM208_g13208 [Fusarium decemcellulare]|uniref:Uncharacterized protein n=1 Tax=Fusarium decemcellulare TaxID=57161 RepID=A0ACC1RKN3_9HYPO|nr:hypothetical protein NM208_g13208 [Fusarium decemcellulare]